MTVRSFMTRGVHIVSLIAAIHGVRTDGAAHLLGFPALRQTVDVSAQIDPWPREPETAGRQKPTDPPQRWLGLIGEYGAERDPLYVLERSGHLWMLRGRGQARRLEEIFRDVFSDASDKQRQLTFKRDTRGRATSAALAGVVYNRLQVGPTDGVGQLRVEPVRPVTELLKEALEATPPKESNDLLPSDLVEIVRLDPTIKLDIRYATTNNFLGSVFYAEARAFLQRPAALAVTRAHQALKKSGYGLLIHDGYRPWFVTKTFWDATPQDKKWLVADPTGGSRHNRGAAIDVTLYELNSGRAVEMPSTYDESTPRAYAFYPGGTDAQRWRRALLRRVLEAEGFTVNPLEWWHFDYQNWGKYRIGNAPFAEIKTE